MAEPKSTIQRPPEAAIRRFNASQVGDDTVGDYLAKGWSLGICCKACSRLTEWAPPVLVDRFGDRAGLRIADLVPRLACAGEGGCGSREIAVFPHLYDGAWTWTPPA
jgi:hypothetical protein